MKNGYADYCEVKLKSHHDFLSEEVSATLSKLRVTANKRMMSNRTNNLVLTFSIVSLVYRTLLRRTNFQDIARGG